jgi:hypothetical protein
LDTFSDESIISSFGCALVEAVLGEVVVVDGEDVLANYFPTVSLAFSLPFSHFHDDLSLPVLHDHVET